jgi:hypothetical protein
MSSAYATFKKQAVAIKALTGEGKVIMEGLKKYIGLESKMSEHFRVEEDQPHPDHLRVSLYGISLLFRFHIRLGEQSGEGIICAYCPSATEAKEILICEKCVIKLNGTAGEVSYVKDNPNDLSQFVKDKINESVLLAVADGLVNKNLVLGLKW